MRIYARKLNRRSLRVASVMLETIIPRSLRLPSRLNSSLPFATSFLSFQHVSTLPFHSLLPLLSLSFQRFHLGHLPFPFVSQGVHLVTSFHSFQLVHPVRLPIRFVATRPFHLLLLSFGFHSCISFVASSLSFQLFPSVRYVIPFVSTLPFHSLFPLFVSALPSRSFTSSFVSSH